ncbi:Ferredoxin-thioredoxin reductase, variable chain [Acaryochloris thomasi RCC1774]|uniref:Ferredoxin-thioredoxin reductase, variable chain n=1 Tax=Acaryochloris thomasi RCC1774 TaxID=1764569 RepID=A0A2W1JHA5_9CYAN|nr:ferredoxin-thioredoxin reductase variable chain [Acaryochloris thomasi]PZD72898.1 Ferredoxin-thioredoxin reductase, variable chain [Acaryochloris thomasi RCC1774]
MQVGDSIRVKESVTVYHYPDHRNQPFDLRGQTGEIMAILESWRGRAISPNLPVHVKFDNKFTAHFLDNELEPISQGVVRP